MTRKPDTPPRKGWTTGACATAAAAASYEALLTGSFPDPVTIALPKGERPSFRLHRSATGSGWAEASVIKDAGDDPDVTHGAEVVARVAVAEADSGIAFRAGSGVGTVTLPGLPLEPGEPAINPSPRAMIEIALTTLAERHGTSADVVVTVSIPGGEALAEKTMNGRLGIKGGLSVLGTTGVVIPYSCASWIHSIHRGVDVARAAGIPHLWASTGSTSEAAVVRLYDPPEQALIEMGDFAGGLLKYLRRHPAPRLTLAGGFAKLCKLAQGELDLHSSRSSVDFTRLGAWATEAGGDAPLAERIGGTNTAMEAREICRQAGVDLADGVARRAREAARAVVSGETEIDVMIFDRKGERIGRSG